MPTSILTSIQNEINFIGYPILMFFGNIGNIFVIIVFSRQRQNTCSLYLINSAIVNILHLTINGFLKIFSYSYNDASIRALILCKLSNYGPAFLGQVTKTMIVFACIDRYMITSHRATIRAFSTPKRTKYIIFFSYIFWLVVSSHLLIWTIISNGQCTKVGFYVTFYACYTIFLIGLIPSGTLCVFGYLTYRNMRQLRNRIQPTEQDASNVNNSIQRRDRDLLVLVTAEAIVYIITTSLLPLVYLETTISQYVIPHKSLQYTLSEIFALNIAILLIFIFSAAPFYTYMISSASFRRDFKQMIIKSYWKVTNQLPEQNPPTKTKRTSQHDTRV